MASSLKLINTVTVPVVPARSKALCSACAVVPRQRLCFSRKQPVPKRQIAVRSDKISRWGDTDGREDDTDDGVEDDGFEKCVIYPPALVCRHFFAFYPHS